MEDAVLIIGLGNPGPQYELTRHNFGFLVLDKLAEHCGAIGWNEKFSGHMCRVNIKNQPCILLKPMTFMNLSGRSVSRAAQFFRVAVDNMIVIHDELDLPFESIRIKNGGGTAGHKGLISLKQDLGDTEFARIRMGIGRPERGSVSDYVLHKFSNDEMITLTDVIEKGSKAVESIIGNGLTVAMNRLNKRGGEKG